MHHWHCTMMESRTRKRDVARDVACVSASFAARTAKELTTKREAGALPKAVTDLIGKIDGIDEKIERMLVVRTPVSEFVGKLLQVASMGKYRDAVANSPYDEMFHLSLLINGRYNLEKNEVISLTDTGPSVVTKRSDFMAVKIPEGARLSFAALLDGARDKMGPGAFSDYDAVSNNCQDFILAVLEGNGLAYPHLVSFLKQDSGKIFDQLPMHMKTVARALTDVAAVGNKVAEDIRVKHEETDYVDVARRAGRTGWKAMAGNKRAEGARKRV